MMDAYYELYHKLMGSTAQTVTTTSKNPNCWWQWCSNNFNIQRNHFYFYIIWFNFFYKQGSSIGKCREKCFMCRSTKNHLQLDKHHVCSFCRVTFQIKSLYDLYHWSITNTHLMCLKMLLLTKALSFVAILPQSQSMLGRLMLLLAFLFRIICVALS